MFNLICHFVSHPAHWMLVPADGVILDVGFEGNIWSWATDCLVANCLRGKTNVSEETRIVAQIVAKHHSLGLDDINSNFFV